MDNVIKFPRNNNNKDKFDKVIEDIAIEAQAAIFCSDSIAVLELLKEAIPIEHEIAQSCLDSLLEYFESHFEIID